MNHNILPKQYDQYEWIAKQFGKVKGVEAVLMNVNADGVDLVATNLKTGKQSKVYNFPLRRLFFVDYTTSSDTPHPYDVMELDDPRAMVKLAEVKMYHFFKE